jgi:retinol-binding protein 3
VQKQAAIQLAKKIAVLLHAEYVFLAVAAQISALVMHKAETGAYDQVSDDDSLAHVLTRDLRQVNNDKHLLVAPTLPSRRDTSQQNLERRIRLMQEHNFGFKSVKLLDSKVGYLEIDALIDAAIEGAGQAAVDAMQKLADAEYLIFDLRENSGGSPTMIQLLSSYLFLGEPLHLNSFYFRKTDTYKQFWTLPYVPGKRKPDVPVYVLISNSTFSGAEEFAYNLQAMKRATIIAAVSGGGANPGDFLPLTDSLDIFIPHGRAINPVTGTNWEGKGVQPDVACTPEAALQAALALCVP